MFKTRSFFKYWLPVIIWMMVIFSASGDHESFQHSSRIIAPLMRWLFPSITETNLDHVVLAVRKCAHLAEYMVLAFLFWRAVCQPVQADPRPWNPKLAMAAVVFVAIYAATDEYHQRFVPSRGPSVHDVLIDTTGAAIGMVFLRQFWNRRQRRLALKSDQTVNA